MTDGHHAPHRSVGTLLAVALIAAAGLVVLAVSWGAHGPGVSPDSVGYLWGARSLARAEGWIDPSGAPVTAWPPGYAAYLALAVGGADRLPDIADRAAWLGAASWLVYVAGLAAYLLRVVRPPWALLGLLLATGSWPLLRVFGFVWSETLFLALLALFLALLERARHEGGLRWHGLVFAVASIAPLVRYTGIVLIPAAAITLLLSTRSLRGALRAACLSAAAALPLAALLARNVRLTGSLTGERGAAAQGLAGNARDALQTFAAWWGLGDVAAPFPLLVKTGLVCGTLLALVVLARLRRGGDGRGPLAAVVTAACFGSFVLVMSSVVGFDPLGPRLLAPLLPCLAAIWVAAGERLGLSREPRVARTGPLAAATLLAGLVACSLPAVYSGARRAHAEGIGGYTSALWQRSELAGRLSDLPRPATIVSNAPRLVAFLADRPASRSPRARHYRSQETIEGDLAALRDAAGGPHPVLVAWFDLEEAPHLVQPRALAEQLELDVLLVASDGFVARVAPGPPGAR